MSLSFHGTTPSGLSVPPLAIGRGDVIGLSGRSGSGKSRLMRALADLDRSDLTITLDGLPRRQVPFQEWRTRVLYCAATPAWWEDDRIDALFKAPEEIGLLEALGLARALWSTPLTQLSTGEQQRAHVARHLCMAPDVLMLDEPTSALDREATATIERVIREAAGRGAVLLTSHDPHQVDRLATRHWQISDGRIVESQEQRA